jgi:uncharacterized protein YciI
MTFDSYCVALLTLCVDPPSLSAQEAAELQDSHMAHLADLHDAGLLLVAGPLEDVHYRGLMILKTNAESARRLLDDDPAVRAGRFDVTVVPWMVPGGLLTFTPAKLPRSISEIG